MAIPPALPRVAALLLAAALALSPATAAEPDGVELRIEMYAIAGLHVLTVRETISESADHYAITMGLESRGIADLFASIDSHTEVEGRIVEGQAYSERFHSDIRRGSRESETTATYGSEGVLSYRTSPLRSELRSPVTPELLRGAVDEHTAYYRLERQLARHGSCALSVPVFDGLHRFDLMFTDMRAQEASIGDAGHGFGGPVKACEVTRRKMAGFPADGGGREGLDHGRMWFAHLLPGALMIPVKMELDTELGIVTGYLAEVHGHGVNLALMQ